MMINTEFYILGNKSANIHCTQIYVKWNRY